MIECVVSTFGVTCTSAVDITINRHCSYDYYDYIMAPQRGRPYGANLGSMGRDNGTIPGLQSFLVHQK